MIFCEHPLPELNGVNERTPQTLEDNKRFNIIHLLLACVGLACTLVTLLEGCLLRQRVTDIDRAVSSMPPILTKSQETLSDIKSRIRQPPALSKCGEAGYREQKTGKCFDDRDKK